MTINGASKIHLALEDKSEVPLSENYSVDLLQTILVEIRTISINQNHMNDKIDSLLEKMDNVDNRLIILEQVERDRSTRSAFVWKVIQASPWICFGLVAAVALLCALGGIKVSQGITYEINKIVKEVRKNI